MSKIKQSRLFYILLIALLPANSSICSAQSEAAKININITEELDNYNPPQMFEPKIERHILPEIMAPLTSPIRTSPTLTYLNKTSLNKLYTSIPGRKPHFAGAKTSKSPPLPPKRPKIFYASSSFIKKARASIIKGQTSSARKPVIIHHSNTKANDPLQKQLVKPTAHEVLASIDSNKANDLSIISLGYLPGIFELTEEIKHTLTKNIISPAKQKPYSRIEIKAFASPDNRSKSSARRVSLARALEIRSFLMENSIPPERIDIRPMGNTANTGPSDRVDIEFIKR